MPRVITVATAEPATPIAGKGPVSHNEHGVKNNIKNVGND